MATLTIGTANAPSRLIPKRLAMRAAEEAATRRTAVRQAVADAMRANGERPAGTVVGSDESIAQLMGRTDRDLIESISTDLLVLPVLALACAMVLGAILSVAWYAFTGDSDWLASPTFRYTYLALAAPSACYLVWTVLRPTLDKAGSLRRAIDAAAFTMSYGDRRIYVGAFVDDAPEVREILYDAIGKVEGDAGEIAFIDRTGREIGRFHDINDARSNGHILAMARYVRSRISP